MRQLEMYIYYNRWSKMITITTFNQDFGNYISKAAHIFSILVGGGGLIIAFTRNYKVS